MAFSYVPSLTILWQPLSVVRRKCKLQKETGKMDYFLIIKLSLLTEFSSACFCLGCNRHNYLNEIIITYPLHNPYRILFPYCYKDSLCVIAYIKYLYMYM